nr:MAG TPA: hypothetical protein [Caudoviricetes sp.]
MLFDCNLLRRSRMPFLILSKMHSKKFRIYITSMKKTDPMSLYFVHVIERYPYMDMF